MLSGKIAETEEGQAINALKPTVAQVIEHPHTNRWNRRHFIVPKTGAKVNIPKSQRSPGLNVPYRKGSDEQA